MISRFQDQLCMLIFHFIRCIINSAPTFYCNLIAEYIEQRKPLGGLLLLLPPVFSPQNIETGDGADVDSARDPVKEALGEVERVLIHANIPVSN